MERLLDISANQPKIPEKVPEKTTEPVRRITITPERSDPPSTPVTPITTPPQREPVPSR